MKKTLLLISALVTLPMAMHGQELKPGYITVPNSSDLATYVSAWNNGAGTITIDGKTWEDEEFFTSRVKPRMRFQNTATQIYKDRVPYNATTGAGTDKRLVYWVPVSDDLRNATPTNALPNGVYDQEVFSLWSYMDHWGNWTAPYGWTPGVFADIAHKNGVAVSGVASVPYGGINGTWSTAFNAITGVDATKVAKFLYYHGQDGLGYNSEWNGYAPTSLHNMHSKIKSYYDSQNSNNLWEVIWYGGTMDNGYCSFDQGVDSRNNKNFTNASMFLNYNWNSTSTMTRSINYAKNEVKKNPFYIYAGMNQQGGEPKGGDNWPILKDYQYSIGMWAGHNTNIMWLNRQKNGSDALSKQQTYQQTNEMFFGNGARNPAIRQSVETYRNHFPDENFHGCSSMMNARSTIQMNIGTEPFITYFNLGNGTFFNWRGDRQNDNPWYNIGIQDYMPTWRWWFAPAWMQTNVTAGTTHMSADFTWEDAYMGGSCLKISGTTGEEYLHLFKTDLTGISSKVVKVYYKILAGEGDVRLRLGSKAAPATYAAETQSDDYQLATVGNSINLQDQSYAAGQKGWIVRTIEISSNPNRKGLGNIGVVGLEFKNCKDLQMLLGGFEMVNTTATTKPNKPTIKLAKVLAYSHNGVDAKLVWTMDGDAGRNSGTPVYNSDVNAVMYKMYSQQQGGEIKFIGATTSWAGILFKCPAEVGKAEKMRFGVKAVPVDFDEQGDEAISWSDYVSLPSYEMVDEIVCNKAVIKPGEEFTLNFKDSKMPSATWKLINADNGQTKYTATGKTITCPGLSDIGSYNVEVTYSSTASRSSVTKTFSSFVAISSEAVGALPQIYSLTIDGNTVSDESPDVEINTSTTAKQFGYTGRYADGLSSRGVDLAGRWVGVANSELGIQARESFSIATWLRIDQLPEGRSSFVTVEDRTGGGWPYDNWGYFWSRITQDGTFVDQSIDTDWGKRTGTGTEGNRLFYRFDDAKVTLGAWTHYAIVFEYNASGGVREHFYINGKKMTSGYYININKGTFEGIVARYNNDWSRLELGQSNAINSCYGSDLNSPKYSETDLFPISASMYISVGGTSQNISALRGSVDDFQVWGKAMTEDEVKASMAGLDKNNLPSTVLGYWDFESEANSDNSISGYAGSSASNKSPKLYCYSIGGNNSRVIGAPMYLSGCPFLSGTAYKIETKPTWTTRGTQEGAAGTGEQGNSEISFARANDYTVELTLANGHGSDSKVYPVIKVSDVTAIDGIEADEQGVATYTVDHMLFVDFAEEGDYRVMVFNTAGQMSAAKDINATAGQTAQISLRNTGIYLVKIVKDGRELRTVKVVCK